MPRQTFDGKELYPTIIDKAAILFCAINKNHAFRNGNKRISAASLMVFLFINDKWLDAGKTEIVEKTLYVAKSGEPGTPKKEEVMEDIKRWIGGHIIDAPEADDFST
ncbi:MAG: type II toxin-antitoxin system death-on-curing family toxin, partial [Patescibacteria group bacterium]